MIWWVMLGGTLVLVGAVVLRSPKARRKVWRWMRRQWKQQRRHTQRARPRPPKQAPLTGRAQQVARRPVLRVERCSAACRTSRKPLYDKHGRMTCDCPCGGRHHGAYRRGQATAARVGSGRTVGSSGTKRVPPKTTKTATKPKPVSAKTPKTATKPKAPAKPKTPRARKA